MLEELLKNTGLSKNEALVYGTLLRQSPAGASLIAKKCNLARSSVYTSLSSLISEGLVGTTYKNEVKQFTAEDVSSLKNILEEKQKDIKKKLDTFDSLQEKINALSANSEAHIPQIVFFEGQEGLKRIYMSMVRGARKGASLYLLRDEFVWSDDWKFIFEEEWHDRVSRYKQEKNIQTKLLINPSKLEKEKEEFYKSKKGTEVHYLSCQNMIKDFAMYIMEDVVSIMSMEEKNLVGIKITNKQIAENFKQLFLGLW